MRETLIYLITDGSLTAENFRSKSVETLSLIERAVRAGVSFVQIREKSITTKQLYELTAQAAQCARPFATKLLVNDRADVALAAGADGVHLTANSLAVEIIRRTFGAEFIVGVSTHSLAEVEKAQRSGANFAVFGHVFPTPSKANYGAPQGVAKLREVSETVDDFPVIALGGIDENNFGECLRNGASGIAAIRFFAEAKNLSEIVEQIREFEK